MSSVATNAFAWALEYVSDWEIDDLERRVAFDLWAGERGVGPAATPGSQASIDRGAIAATAAKLASGEITSVALVEHACVARGAEWAAHA